MACNGSNGDGGQIYPEEIGEPCDELGDCPSGICLDLGAGRYACTVRCDQDRDCPPGWVCQTGLNIEGGWIEDVCDCASMGTESCNGRDDDCDGQVDEGTGEELGCAAGEVCRDGACHCDHRCGDVCVDIDSDPENCGACDNACMTGAACQDGDCVCPFEVCGEKCVDIDSDPENCGSCDNACALGGVCQEGQCQCPGDGRVCAGECTNIANDRENCGGCGNACLLYCSEGNCIEAVQVAAGGATSCALLQDQTVWCWGSSFHGELAAGTSNGESLVPVELPDPVGVIQLSLGRGHVCALLEGSTVVCWGDNRDGQLGDGTDRIQCLPTPVIGLDSVEQITCGDYHTCARLSDRTVKCWGRNESGQLGDGSTENRNLPVPVSGLAGVSRVTAGLFHTCALLDDGCLRCWGDNQYGQVADDPATEFTTPVPGPELAGLVSVSSGNWHNCGLLDDGTVWCWGLNEDGQLGDGTHDNQRPIPAPISEVGTAAGVTAGDSVTFVWLQDGNPFGCGVTRYDILGYCGDAAYRVLPTPVENLTDVVHIDSAANHACALRTDGNIWCWGYNNVGQLGNGTEEESCRAGPVFWP